MTIVTMKCACGFVVHCKGEAAMHLDRASHYAGDSERHAFTELRRKPEPSQATPSNDQSDYS